VLSCASLHWREGIWHHAYTVQDDQPVGLDISDIYLSKTAAVSFDLTSAEWHAQVRSKASTKFKKYNGQIR
jgi:hypothetical protein